MMPNEKTYIVHGTHLAKFDQYLLLNLTKLTRNKNQNY